MNYLVATDGCFPDRPSGSARVAWDIAQLMRDRGHRVSLFCWRVPDSDCKPGIDHIDGIEILRADKPSVGSFNLRRFDTQIHAGAAAISAAWPDRAFDLVHMHVPLSGLAAWHATRSRKPRYICTAHSPVLMEQQINWAAQGLPGRLKWLVGRRQMEKLERGVLEPSQTIHVLSQYTRAQLNRFYSFDDRIRMIPHWNRPDYVRTVTKAEARKQLGWPADVPILFTIRRHVARMGLDTALAAAAPFAKQGRCVFYVAGSGPLTPQLRAQAASLGCTDSQIVFPGRLSEEDLKLAYQAADLFVLPTRALECFGLIVLEAMSMGCPVIATHVGSIPELLTPISPDLLFPPGDVPALHHLIDQWLNDTLPLPDSDKLVRYIANNYGESVVAPRFIELLERNS